MDEYTGYPRKRTFYDRDPDFTRPLYEMPSEVRQSIMDRLKLLYGEEAANRCMPEVERLLKAHYAHKPPEMLEKEKNYDPVNRFSEADMALITYGDIVRGGGRTPLSTLHDFINTHSQGAINTLHILPFFPYSSDRGFAVIDFKRVDPKLGSWDDIREKKARYDLMFDAVLNHVSSRSEIFREFLKGNPRYKDFFITYDSPGELTPEQLKLIFRPRTSDILSRFDTIEGPKWVWTTFSNDQIDLNFHNPNVFLNILGGILFYVRRGADILRLDAVTYLWHEVGTKSVHLPQTHEIIKLLRNVVDSVCSGVALVTETNVPHRDNISYFGNGFDEAHMVYNFALPPLVLYTFYRGCANSLSQWAAQLEAPSSQASFFNILDTHDGIGLMGVKDILSKEEIDLIIANAKQRGGQVSYKMHEGEAEEPYEINSTWWSAVNGDENAEEMTLQVKRYIATRSISLVIKGVPGVYIHGLLGTSNDYDLMEQTGTKRDLNRGMIDCEAVKSHLGQANSKLSLIGRHIVRLHKVRTRERAFHPGGGQKVLNVSPGAFTVLREAPDGGDKILALTNVTDRRLELEIPCSSLGKGGKYWFDLLGDKRLQEGTLGLKIVLEEYGVMWLKRVK